MDSYFMLFLQVTKSLPVGGNSWKFYVSVWRLHSLLVVVAKLFHLGAGDDSNHQGMKIDRGYISPYFITDTKAWPQRLIGWVALLRSGM